MTVLRSVLLGSPMILSFVVLINGSLVYINTVDIYRSSKRKYEDQQRGWRTEGVIWKEPTWREAFHVALDFQIKYVLSLGEVNNTNYDFDMRFKNEIT